MSTLVAIVLGARPKVTEGPLGYAVSIPTKHGAFVVHPFTGAHSLQGRQAIGAALVEAARNDLTWLDVGAWLVRVNGAAWQADPSVREQLIDLLATPGSVISFTMGTIGPVARLLRRLGRLGRNLLRWMSPYADGMGAARRSGEMEPNRPAALPPVAIRSDRGPAEPEREA
jgi:transposase-like protein